MVFYFTGTGNSLYIAKQIEENILSIPQIMRRDYIEFTEEAIGIVAPVYGHEVPNMVKDFLKKAIFNTDYFYIILTYGNRHGGAAELTKKLCDECGVNVDYINVIEMVDNWLPSFDMEEQKKIDKEVEKQLAIILNDLNTRKSMISEVTETDYAAHTQFLERMRQMPIDMMQHILMVTDSCIGCSICEKVCPSSSMHVKDGRAIYVPGNCQTCLACAHACPQKAIGLTIPEKNPRARYRNEHISLNEIIKSNSQISDI